MYCSSCGVAVAKGLSYCNYCGAKLSGAQSDNVVTSSEIKPELVVSAMVAVFVLGLVCITMLIGAMKSVLELSVGPILSFAILTFLIMLFLEGVFLRLLFRRNRGAAEAARTEQLESHATKVLDALNLHIKYPTSHRLRRLCKNSEIPPTAEGVSKAQPGAGIGKRFQP